MKATNLKDIVGKTCEAYIKAEELLSSILFYVKIKYIGEHEVNVSMCTGNEIILILEDERTIQIEIAIELMESKGYIDIDDFHY